MVTHSSKSHKRKPKENHGKSQESKQGFLLQVKQAIK
jgi:hypothetical protein